MNKQIKFYHITNDNKIILTYNFTIKQILNMKLEDIKFLSLLKINQLKNNIGKK